MKLTFLFLLILSLLFNCDKSKEEINQEENSSSSITSNSIDIYSNTEKIAEITIGNSIFISFNEEKIHSKKKEEKRKYYDKSQNLLVEVKHKDDGFKLKDNSGNLLWKIKIKENKIKISNNEEGTDPVEIKMKDSENIKLIIKEMESIVKYDPSSKKIVLLGKENDLNLTSNSFDQNHGVLFVNEINQLHRWIIFAELNSK
jgi:hypothetical protein